MFRGRRLAIGVLLVLMGAGSSMDPAYGQSSTTVQVVAGQPWTDSNVQVTAGAGVHLTASGTIEVAGWRTDNPPTGDPNCVHAGPRSGFVAPNLPCWVLLARIGTDGPIVEVGNALDFVAATSGELYLGVNDDQFLDNHGSWTVLVTVVPAVSVLRIRVQHRVKGRWTRTRQLHQRERVRFVAYYHRADPAASVTATMRVTRAGRVVYRATMRPAVTSGSPYVYRVATLTSRFGSGSLLARVTLTVGAASSSGKWRFTVLK